MRDYFDVDSAELTSDDGLFFAFAIVDRDFYLKSEEETSDEINDLL